MRWVACFVVVTLGLFVSGCGDSGGGGGGQMAGGGASPPPPPGSGPPAPGGPESSPPPSDSPPPAAENPPPEYGGSQPGVGSPDGGQPPQDAPPPGSNEGNPEGDPNGQGPPKPPPRPKTLHDRAIDAFRAGRDVEGFKLLNTYFAVMPMAGQELADKMAWIPALSRPALGPRIGIAIEFNESTKTFAGRPMPIGSPELTAAVDRMQAAQAADNRIGGTQRVNKFGTRGMPGMASKNKMKMMMAAKNKGKGGAGRGEDPAERLDYYTGDFGTDFVEALAEKINAGEYGRIYRELAAETGASFARAARRTAADDPNNPSPVGDDSPQPGNPGSSEAGQPGDNGQSNDGGAGGGNQGRASRRGSNQFSLGIAWLGKVENREELLKAAADANVDVVAVFDVTLREARTGNLVNNTTKLKISYAKKPGVIFTSDELVNLKVEQWRQQDQKGTDPVEQEVKQAIEALDKVLKPIPLPEALTSERAKKRIDDLVAGKPADPLPVIVEARYYVAKGLLQEGDMTAAAVALLGEAEYAQLIARASGPSAGAGMGQAVGGALSLPGALSLLQGVNYVTGHTARAAEAKKRTAATASKRKSDPAASGGGSLKNLLPFGFGGQGKK